MATNQFDASRLPKGTPVQVRDRFQLDFRSGFEVSSANAAGYRLRRCSDGVELPVDFSASDVRPESATSNWR